MMLSTLPAFQPSISIPPDLRRTVLHGFFNALVWIAAIAVTLFRLARVTAAVFLEPPLKLPASQSINDLFMVDSPDRVNELLATPLNQPAPVFIQAARPRSRGFASRP